MSVYPQPFNDILKFFWTSLHKYHEKSFIIKYLLMSSKHWENDCHPGEKYQYQIDFVSIQTAPQKK